MTIFSRHAVLAMIMLSNRAACRAFGAKVAATTILFSAVSEHETMTSQSLQETSEAYGKLIQESSYPQISYTTAGSEKDHDQRNT